MPEKPQAEIGRSSKNEVRSAPRQLELRKAAPQPLQAIAAQLRLHSLGRSGTDSAGVAVVKHLTQVAQHSKLDNCGGGRVGVLSGPPPTHRRTPSHSVASHRSISCMLHNPSSCKVRSVRSPPPMFVFGNNGAIVLGQGKHIPIERRSTRECLLLLAERLRPELLLCLGQMHTSTRPRAHLPLSRARLSRRQPAGWART